ncbi:MAG: hypothetical protein RUMPE_00642 [Eubacteriales bacterium SKADARSKE-1]|nr:hypothetical protein [Eubacteriales bacterium SKADARSKE-1]
MSDAKIREFYGRMEENKDFYKKLVETKDNIKDDEEKLSKIIKEAVIPFAKKSGYDFTLEELLKYEEKKEPNIKKLTISNLEMVSGGIGRRTAGTLLSLLTIASGIGTAGAAFAGAEDNPSTIVASEPDVVETTSVKDRMRSMKGTLEKTIRPGVSPEDIFRERVAAKRAAKSKSPGTSAPTTEGSSFAGIKLLGTVMNAMTGKTQPAFTLVNWYNTYVSQFNLMVLQSDNDQAALAYSYAQEVALVLNQSNPNDKQTKSINVGYELFKVAYEKWKDNLDGKLPEGCETEPTDPFNVQAIKAVAAVSISAKQETGVPTPPPAPPMPPTSPSSSPGPSDKAGLFADIQRGVKLRKPGSSVQQATPQEKKQEPSAPKQDITPQKKTAGEEVRTSKAEEVRKSGSIITYEKKLKNGETTILVYNSQSHVLDGDVSELTSSDLDKMGVKYDFECRDAVPLGKDLVSKGWEKVTKISGLFKSNYRYAKVVSEKASTNGVLLMKKNDGNVYVEDHRSDKTSPVKLTKEDLEKVKKLGANAVWCADKFELSEDVQSSWEQKNGWVYYGYHMK